MLQVPSNPIQPPEMAATSSSNKFSEKITTVGNALSKVTGFVLNKTGVSDIVLGGGKALIHAGHRTAGLKQFCKGLGKAFLTATAIKVAIESVNAYQRTVARQELQSARQELQSNNLQALKTLCPEGNRPCIDSELKQVRAVEGHRLPTQERLRDCIAYTIYDYYPDSDSLPDDNLGNYKIRDLRSEHSTLFGPEAEKQLKHDVTTLIKQWRDDDIKKRAEHNKEIPPQEYLGGRIPIPRYPIRPNYQPPVRVTGC